MKKILIFLFEGAELFEIATFTDIFGWNNIVGTKDIKVETLALSKKIKCTWGGEILVDKILDENYLKKLSLEDFSALIVPGGFGKNNFFKDKENSNFKTLVNYFEKNNKYIVGICSGVINLLETGEIQNKKVTTYLLDNKRYFNQLKKFDVIPIEKEICVDKNLLTCSGPGNSLNLAFFLLEFLTSKKNKEIVLKNMCIKL